MNELNHATLEASKRLVDAGIVLETDVYWVYDPYNSQPTLRSYEEWNKEYISSQKISAPTMAEVWRELHKYLRGNLFVAQGREEDTEIGAWIESTAFDGFSEISEIFKSINPTDALIDLLIWVRKEKP